MKKTLSILSAFIFTCSLLIVLLITSIETVVYWTPGYFKQEFEKYNITQSVSMTMEDLLDVTEQMMDYLRGNRSNLHISTTVDGQSREFFNQKEISHMEDVRDLFLKSILLRRICLILLASSLLAFVFIRVPLFPTLFSLVWKIMVFFVCVTGVTVGIIASDFNRYFILFHHLFFNNDLWILNPDTDLLINIVPEPFFMDTAARIGVTFGVSLLIVFLVSFLFSAFTCPEK